MLPLTGGHRLRHGLCPVDVAPASRSPGGTARPARVLALLIFVLGLSVACGPSDEEVVQAAEESISGLSQVAVNNLRCSVAEALTEGNRATDTMERYSSMMEELTDSLESDGTASNREKMRLIDEMNDLRED